MSIQAPQLSHNNVVQSSNSGKPSVNSVSQYIQYSISISYPPSNSMGKTITRAATDNVTISFFIRYPPIVLVTFSVDSSDRLLNVITIFPTLLMPADVVSILHEYVTSVSWVAL